MTLRFKVGDLARLIYLPDYFDGCARTGPGDVVTISQVGPFTKGQLVFSPWGLIKAGRAGDYIAECGDEGGVVNDSWLMPFGLTEEIEQDEEAHEPV